MDYLRDSAPQITREEEVGLLVKYITDGDNEAGGTIVHARVPWILRVLKRSGLPNWADVDSILADVMSDMYESLRNFDIKGDTSISGYMAQIVRRVARRSAAEQSEQVFGSPAPYSDEFELTNVIETKTPLDVIDLIRQVFDRIPESELNESSRYLATRLIQGATPADLAASMGWSLKESKLRCTRMRQQIAWRLLDAGLSAAPWITDKQLREMASEWDDSSGDGFI